MHETRAFFLERESQGDVPEDVLQRARRELDIAEGSDWYWWFGDDHSSSQDYLFDQLFRRHLENVYTLLGNRRRRGCCVRFSGGTPGAAPRSRGGLLNVEAGRPQQLLRMAQRRALRRP
ncbi:MAG: hypothetical protein U0992_07790 [Planctomycetaceae bacterium]